jgi:hypothetical protein
MDSSGRLASGLVNIVRRSRVPEAPLRMGAAPAAPSEASVPEDMRRDGPRTEARIRGRKGRRFTIVATGQTPPSMPPSEAHMHAAGLVKAHGSN